MPGAPMRAAPGAGDKNGERRTVYFTKKLPKEVNNYARTGQYLGEWRENRWHGKGTLERANGTRYVGEWVEGQRSGVGTLWIKQSGQFRKRYTGQWLNDQPHGRGSNYYKNGDSYNGEWRNGVRHGTGVMRYADGGVYDGEWFNNKRHGFGVYDYPNGDHFEGLWVEDKKEGEGVHFYFSKEKRTHTKRYDGEWVDDLPKCGFYTEMPPDPLVPDSFVPDPLPRTEVIAPDEIISERLGDIREERAHIRAKRVPLDDQLTPEELDALQEAFSRVDVDGSGQISLERLPEAFGQVGMEIAEDELEQLLVHLDKPNEPATNFSFAEFAQAADFLSPIEGDEPEPAAFGSATMGSLDTAYEDDDDDDDEY